MSHIDYFNIKAINYVTWQNGYQLRWPRSLHVALLHPERPKYITTSPKYLISYQMILRDCQVFFPQLPTQGLWVQLAVDWDWTKISSLYNYLIELILTRDFSTSYTQQSQWQNIRENTQSLAFFFCDAGKTSTYIHMFT